MKQKQKIHGLIDFIQSSPSPYHAVCNMVVRLRESGFLELKEKDLWELAEEGKYFVIRGDSSIIAFKLGKDRAIDPGFRIVGAHTDSPGFKVRPNPDCKFQNYLTLGVEVYGSPILEAWFDRDLSLAGRISFIGESGEFETALLDFKRPVAMIPNLAIHLTPKNKERKAVNPQKEIVPLFYQFPKSDKSKKLTFADCLKEELQRQKSIKAEKILDYDLLFYDQQKPQVIGFNDRFLAGARLDNLVSCYCGLNAIIESKNSKTLVLVCNDHEEIGSRTYIGAAGPFLESLLQRVCEGVENLHRHIAGSMLVSADNAHGIHPNYSDRHDEQNAPLLNGGVVLKVNANQRYATDSNVGGRFRQLCHSGKIPIQSFVNRSDLNCGSTIGPITATALGMQTLDVGIPTFAMHSIRELCGVDDIDYLQRSLTQFYSLSN